jgi:hypothetical protein
VFEALFEIFDEMAENTFLDSVSPGQHFGGRGHSLLALKWIPHFASEPENLLRKLLKELGAL